MVTVAYEDLYPKRGDYDFNDLVISYRCRVDLNADGDVVQLSREAYLRARGAGYVHDWDLRIPLTDTSINGSIVVQTAVPSGDAVAERIATYTQGDIRIPVIRDGRGTSSPPTTPWGSAKPMSPARPTTSVRMWCGR